VEQNKCEGEAALVIFIGDLELEIKNPMKMFKPNN
jgi:hypothetical protein